jgi:hypothetical protein
LESRPLHVETAAGELRLGRINAAFIQSPAGTRRGAFSFLEVSVAAARGDVRLQSGGQPFNTTVEVFDGKDWLRLNGITSISLNLTADPSECRMDIAVLRSLTDITMTGAQGVLLQQIELNAAKAEA